MVKKGNNSVYSATSLSNRLLQIRHQISGQGVCTYLVEGLSTGVVMRILTAMMAVAALLAIGGCFHHNQVYTQEPQVLPPLKLG